MRKLIEWFWRGRSDPHAIGESAVERVLWERIVRIGSIPLVASALIYGSSIVADRLERSHDLARGKPWRVSSALLPGCPSPAQHCAESPNFFFHTRQERQPWLEIDLGSEVQFSSVRVVNRADCCTNRATPLLIDVSSDRTHWQEVAWRIETFGGWKPTFPAVRARWVRLRVLRETVFHLHEVRVLP